MRKTIFALTLTAVLASACAAGAAPAEGLTPTPPSTALPATQPPATPAPSGDSTNAENAAVAQLAETLGLPADQIKVLRAEAVEWPDSCLGIAYPNARCAQAITPGYRITLEADGARYEVHTNQDGSAVAAALPSLSWHREGGIAGFCDDLFVTGAGEARAGSCRSGEAYPAGNLTEAERAQLNAWARKFGSVVIESGDPVAADGMRVVLTMSGTGSGQPSEGEQQTMVAWAQAVYERLKP